MKIKEKALDGIYLGSDELDGQALEKRFLNFEMSKSDYIKINSKNFKGFFPNKNKSYIKALKKTIKEESVNFGFLITEDKVFYKLNGVIKKYNIAIIEDFIVDENFLKIYFKNEVLVIPLTNFKNKEELLNYLDNIYDIENVKDVMAVIAERKEERKKKRKKIIIISLVLALLIISFVAANIVKYANNENYYNEIQDGPGNNPPKAIVNTGVTTAESSCGSTNAIVSNETTTSENINPNNVMTYISPNAFNKNYDYSNENKEAKLALSNALEKVKNNQGTPLSNLQWNKEEAEKFINNPENKSTLTGPNANYELYFMNMACFESFVSFYSENPSNTLADCNNSIDGVAAYLAEIGPNGKLYEPLLEGLQGMEALNDLSKSSNEGCNNVMKLQEEMSYSSTVEYLNKNYGNLQIKNIGVIELGANNLLYRYVMSNTTLYKLYENGDLETVGTI